MTRENLLLTVKKTKQELRVIEKEWIDFTRKQVFWMKNISSQCQRSTDCCSGTCLSFSYKCIGKSNTPFFRPPSSSQNGFIFEVGQQLPSPDNAITIEELVNRFGTGNEDNPLSTNSVLPAGNAVTGRPQNTSSISGSTPRPINASTNTNPNCVGTGGQVILK